VTTAKPNITMIGDGGTPVPYDGEKIINFDDHSIRHADNTMTTYM
jgi:hypothetical protein